MRVRAGTVGNHWMYEGSEARRPRVENVSRQTLFTRPGVWGGKEL